jgi:cation diffusion facilitator family transporter
MQILRSHKIFRIQQWAVAVGVVILLIKFAAFYLTQSTTILTDALEAIVNIVAGIFALYSIALSAKPRDADHPYGHGKIEFLAAGFEGILIVVAALLIIIKSIWGFFHPTTIEHLEYGAILIVVSGIANFALGIYLERKAKEYNAIILEADGKHLQADGYISLAILASIVIIWLTGIHVLDNVFALLVGLFISRTGYQLIRKSLVGIMDETDTDIINPIVAHLNMHRRAPWIDIHNLRVIQYGSTLHIDCHLTLPWYYSLVQTHTQLDDVAQIINESYEYPVEVFIHPDPCVPASCSLCQVAECPERKHLFERKIEWTLERVVTNKKHEL